MTALSESNTLTVRDAAIQQYAPLVKYVIRRLAMRLPATLDYDDMVSYGTIGLIQAIDRFDDTQGLKFEGYAISRVRGAILDALRTLDRLPRMTRQSVKQLGIATFEMTTALDRQPTEAELAERMGMTKRQFNQTLVASSWVTVSLDGLLDRDENDDSCLATEFPSDPNNVDLAQQIEHRELLAALVHGVGKLAQRERLVVGLYYRQGMTMREITQIFDISESRVSQLHVRALSQLRTWLDAERRAA